MQSVSDRLGSAAWKLGSIVVASTLSLVAKAETVPSIPISTPAIVPATYTIGQCPTGQVIIPPGFYAAGTCGIENYWPGRYLNLGGPPVTPACPNGYVLSSFTALYAAPNSALYYQGECKISAKYQCPGGPSNETPYTLSQDQQTCSRPDQENLVITLQGGATIEPGQSTRFTVTVENQLDHQPPKHPVTVNISLKVEATSGGHAHGNSTRPRGSIDNTPCASDATCKTLTIPAGSTTATFDFNSEPAAGTHTVTASCDQCTNGAQSVKVDVMVQGLSGIPASPYYELQELDPNSRPAGQMKNIGGTADHKDNHYVTAAAKIGLAKLARAYNATINPGQKLYINDASLVWGGLLDDDGNWAPPHSTHRRGDAIDIRADSKNKKTGEIPFALFTKVQNADVFGMKPEIHCYTPTGTLVMAKAANPAACNGLNRGRHFHIIFR